MSETQAVGNSRSLRSGGPVFASPNSNSRNPYQRVYAPSAAVTEASAVVAPDLVMSSPHVEASVSSRVVPSDNSGPAADPLLVAGSDAAAAGTIPVLPAVPPSVLSHPVLAMLFQPYFWQVGVTLAQVMALGIGSAEDLEIIAVDDGVFQLIAAILKPIPLSKFSSALASLRSRAVCASPSPAPLPRTTEVPVIVPAPVSRGEGKKKKKAAKAAALAASVPIAASGFPPLPMLPAGKPGPSAAHAQPVQPSPAPSVLLTAHLATPRNLDQDESITTPGFRTPSVSSASSVSEISSIGSRTLGAMLNRSSRKTTVQASKSDRIALAEGTRLTLASRLAFPIPSGPGDLPVFMTPRAIVAQVENPKGGLTVLSIEGSVFLVKRELRKGQSAATVLVPVCGPLSGPHVISHERLVMLQASVGIVIHPKDFAHMQEGWFEVLQQLDVAADPHSRTVVSSTRSAVVNFSYAVINAFRAVFHDSSSQLEDIHATCPTFISSMPYVSAAIHSVTTAAFAHNAPQSLVPQFNDIMGDLWRQGRFGPAYLIVPVVLPPAALLDNFAVCLSYLGYKCPICGRTGMSEQICVFGSNCCKGPVATAAQDYVHPAADRTKALEAWSAKQTDKSLSKDALRLAFNKTAEGKKFLEKKKASGAPGYLYTTVAKAQQFMLDNQTLVTPAVSCLRSGRG